MRILPAILGLLVCAQAQPSPTAAPAQTVTWLEYANWEVSAPFATKYVKSSESMTNCQISCLLWKSCLGFNFRSSSSGTACELMNVNVASSGVTGFASIRTSFVAISSSTPNTNIVGCAGTLAANALPGTTLTTYTASNTALATAQAT